jgi:hypothetical protein
MMAFLVVVVVSVSCLDLTVFSAAVRFLVLLASVVLGLGASIVLCLTLLELSVVVSLADLGEEAVPVVIKKMNKYGYK